MTLAISIVALLVAIASSSGQAQGGVQKIPQESFDPSRIVHPLEMSISGVTTMQGGGQTFLNVSLFATNDLGKEPNYANAVVELQSLKLNVTYQYQTASGTTLTNAFTFTPTTVLSMNPNQQKTLSVNVGALPGIAVGRVTVQVSGWYTWVVHATYSNNGDTLDRTVNGGGRLEEVGGTVIMP